MHAFQEQIEEKKRYTQSLEQQLEQRSVLHYLYAIKHH